MKKFLIIGSANAITYKEVFPLIKNNQLWLGTSKRGMYFVNDGKTVHINSVWFTNLDNKNRHKPLELIKHYNLEEYPRYDNYNAIEVSRTKDIPCDYDGVMGVPITFMDRYCPEQFEIVGDACNGSDHQWDYFKPMINGKFVYKRILIRRKQHLSFFSI